MNRRDIVIGLIILAALAGFIYFRSRQPTPEELQAPQTLSIEEELEEAFKVEIPEDVEKAELEDVTGADATGIATRKFEDGRFTHTVLADLPDAEPGTFYEGWLVRGNPGDEEFHLISTGRMRIAKGGYLLEFESSTDYTDHKNVVITLEEIADNIPEKHILEGSF
jgi:DNA-directed RNA polymerase subunit K/omega